MRHRDRGWVGRATPTVGSVILSLGMIGCSGEDSPAAPEPGLPGDSIPSGPGVPGSAFECEREGFPCSIGEVPLEILDRGQALAGLVAEKVVEAAGTESAAAVLRGLDGVASVVADEAGVRFRLEGGRPTWVVHSDKFAPQLPATPAPPKPSPSRVPVGEPSSKRALVLSPFAWQFGDRDDGGAVSHILEGTRGYAGNVTFKENPDSASSAVSIDDFTGWDEYDVVHVVTHGTYVCEGDDCRGMLAVRRIGEVADGRCRGLELEECQDVCRGLELEGCDDICSGLELEDCTAPCRGLDLTDCATPCRGLELGECDARGLELVHVPQKNPTPLSKLREKYVVVGADFFRERSPEGAGNTIVFINSCRSTSPFGTDLVAAIRSPETTYLGWNETVSSLAAFPAAIELYTRLSEDGTTVSSTYEALGELRTDPYLEAARLILAPRSAGGDHRVRETVWIEDPEANVPMADGTPLRALGRLDDGVADTLPYRIRVDGVEGPVTDFDLTIEIDGRRVDHPTLAQGVPVNQRTWVLEGKALLTRDLKEGDTVPILAYVALPDLGQTEQILAVEIMAEPVAVWAGTASNVFDSPIFGETIVTTMATNLVFRRVADPIWPPGAERYEVASGQLTWSTQGEIIQFFGPNCQYSAGPFTFEVVPGSAYIEIDPNVASGAPRYRLFADFTGDAISIPTTCSGIDHTTRMQSAWMAVFAEDDRRVSPDGNRIQGTRETNLNRWTWELRREFESTGGT